MLSRDYLLHLKAKALRKRVWFKLSLEERSIVDLVCRVVRKIKSRVLSVIISNIVRKIEQLIENNFLKLVYEVGSMLALRFSMYALKWGNKDAAKWAKDEAYMFHLGLSWVNTSPIYR